MIRGLRKFLKLPLVEKKLLGEALVYMWRARLLLFFYPFRKLAPRMGEHKVESPVHPEPRHAGLLEFIRRSLDRAARLVPGKSLCLVKAFAGKMMLARRGISCTIYLGLLKVGGTVVQQSNRSPEQLLSAHAWLRSGDGILSGGDGLDLSLYTVIAMFGNLENSGSG